MVKKKVGNRVYITTEPKVAVYVQTDEDLLHGKHGEKTRTDYENVLAIVHLCNNIRKVISDLNYENDAIANDLGISVSTIEKLGINPGTVQIGVLLKVCGHLNVELKELLK